jgi:hypothetical protein
VEIADLTKKDLDSLVKLFRQFWDESSAVEKMAVMFERLSEDPDYVLLAAKQDDVLVGFCMGIPPVSGLLSPAALMKRRVGDTPSWGGSNRRNP